MLLRYNNVNKSRRRLLFSSANIAIYLFQAFILINIDIIVMHIQSHVLLFLPYTYNLIFSILEASERYLALLVDRTYKL